MSTKVISESGSFEGWRFGKWFFGNWKTIKELIKVGLPLIIGWFATNSPGYTGLITVFGKFIIDLGEYYFKEYSE